MTEEEERIAIRRMRDRREYHENPKLRQYRIKIAKEHYLKDPKKAIERSKEWRKNNLERAREIARLSYHRVKARRALGKQKENENRDHSGASENN